MVKRLQNTHEKVQLGWRKNSKLFHKHDSKHSTALEFKKIKKNQKITKPNTRTNSTNTKIQTQVDILTIDKNEMKYEVIDALVEVNY